MAGDKYHDNLIINNTSSDPITILFKAENTDTDLNGKMILDIILDGKTVYSGDLTSESRSSYKEIATINAGERARFEYTVRLPDDSLNAYSVLADKVLWKFKAVKSSKPDKPVKTGENAEIIIWVFVFTASVSGLYYLMEAGRNKRRRF